MESREENKTYYWTVKGQRVEITEEVYRGILLENERVRRLARNEQRCSRTDSLYCLGDCSACSFRLTGMFRELSDRSLQAISSEDAGGSVEEKVIRKLTVERVYEHADQVVPDGAQILRLRFIECMNSREIAERIGVSHTVVNRRLTRLMAYFQANKRFF